MPSFIDRPALIGAVVLLFVMAAPAAAQNKREISFGYSYLELDDESSPAGWQAAYAREITPVMRWVVDFGGHYAGETTVHTFQGGLRFGLSRTEPFVPFVNVLVGGGYGARDDDGESTLSWAAQFGVGMDFVFRSDGPGLRAQLDFPVFFARDAANVSIRAVVGLVIPF